MNLDTSQVSQTVLQWLSGGRMLFVAEAQSWLRYLAIIMLVLFAARWTMEAIAGSHFATTLSHFGMFVVRLVVATFLLTFYGTPMPFGGTSFSGLIPNTAISLAAHVDTSANQQVIDRIHTIEASLKPGAIWSGTQEFVDICVMELALLIMRGLLFLLSTVGFVAIGIGIAIGPLSIPFLLVPRLNFLFWNWLSFMMASSMFMVVSSLLIAIWSNVLLVVFQNLFAGNYSVIDVASMLPAFVALNCAMLFSCLGIGGITASLYGSAASRLDGFGQSALSLAKG